MKTRTLALALILAAEVSRFGAWSCRCGKHGIITATPHVCATPAPTVERKAINANS